ncbi:MAG: guanosine-5'-triphosphate,3'-diphosphate pyrophosphatase [Succinivibrionaceae bacterium]
MNSKAFQLYASIDLGSNSFNMLIVRYVEGSIRVVSKIRRRVKLASGLDKNNYLSDESIDRALDCLKLFAEQLRDIPRKNVIIVGTATLRLATNSDVFCKKANLILNNDIKIISGEEEANFIYNGVINTTATHNKLLVIDIGGASTELILGEGERIHVLNSTQMGCVSWLNRYFKNGQITQNNFIDAINKSKEILAPIMNDYLSCGFVDCVGASGTIQSLYEILLSDGNSGVVTLSKLYELKQICIDSKNLFDLKIYNLTPEKLSVFPSGISILISIFETFNIEKMSLSGGALREGLIYYLIDKDFNYESNVRSRTLNSLINRYQLDKSQCYRVKNYVHVIFNNNEKIALKLREFLPIIEAACILYEIGQCIDYKNSNKHAYYIINNISMHGYTQSEKKLIAMLLLNQKDHIHIDVLKEQDAVAINIGLVLICFFRIILIICVRRNKDIFQENIIFLLDNAENFILKFPKNWFANNYLRYTLLQEEIFKQQQIGRKLEIIEC